MTQAQEPSTPNRYDDLLLKQYEQVWQQSRHTETMRSQLLALYFAFIGISVLATANLLRGGQPGSFPTIVWLAAINTALLLVTAFTAATILRMRQTLWHWGQEECDYVQRLMRHLPDADDRHLAQNLCPITRPPDKRLGFLSIQRTAESWVIGLLLLSGIVWLGLLGYALLVLVPSLSALPSEPVLIFLISIVPIGVIFLGWMGGRLLSRGSESFREMDGSVCRLDVSARQSWRHDRPQLVCTVRDRDGDPR